LGLDDSYDAVQQGLQNASPDAHSAVNDELAKLAPQLDQLPDETLDQLLQIVQYMHDNPKEYAQCVKELVDAGIISEGDFPEEYDPEFLATLGMVVMQARKTRQGAQQGAMPAQEAPVPPANMARGGIAEAAHMVASRGRGQDTMLAHITPQEAHMLRAKGGMGTINPATGLPEYGFFSDIVKGIGGAVSGVVKGVVGAVKGIVASPIGRVLATVALATFLGPGAFGIAGAGFGATASMALASGAVTAIGGGKLKDVLKSAAIGGATAFFGAPGGVVSNFVGGAVTNAAANAAITSGIVGTGIGLLSGQKLQDAVKSGLTAGAVSGLSTGVTKGFGSQIEAPKLDPVAEMAKNQMGQDVSGNALNDPNRAGASFGQTQMTNSDGTPRVELFNGRPSNMFQNQDGSITYKPVALADRMGPSFPSNSSVSAQTGAPSTSMDPLGDFIQQNDAAREAANTPARVAPPAQGYQTPTIGQSLQTMGGGISDIAQGDFSKGFEGLSKGAGDLFLPSPPTPSDVMSSKSYTDLVNKGISPDKAFEMASKNLSPGILRSYGPATAAGLGIAGLAGAFTPKIPPATPGQSAMNARLEAERARVAANPGAYAPQGMERFGIKYNDRGEIIGSQPFNPQPTGPTEVAATPYVPYMPSSYMTPSGAIGSSTVYQPYNNPNMYNFMPRYAAMGGIMDTAPPSSAMQDMGGIASLATGGYPRRTGPISGPGTETSDSIPAMLSDGEFVMTAKAVRGAGKGDRLSGAKKMYALMHQLERNAARG
jgi:hypothetical protein